MSIIMGALGGAGAAMEDVFGARLKSDMARENELAVGKQRSDLELQRQQTLVVFKNNLDVNTANTQRTAQVGRIDQAAGNLVQPSIDQKRGQVQAGIEDQSNWTPDQQAAVDQSLALDKSKAVADPRVRTQAAIATGDIDPKSAATLTSNADIQQMRSDATLKEIERKIETAKDKNEVSLAIAELKAHLGGSGKAPSGYRFKGDGSLEKIPGGPADDQKPLAGAVLKQLQETRDNAATISNLSQSFKDDFAGKGVLGIGADAQLGASANMGVDKDSVNWWKDYKKQSELVERHAMFGASLTPGEQNSWRSADIGPGMNAEVIKKNLQTRSDLAQRMLENVRQDMVDAGHPESKVNSIAGRRAGERKDVDKAPAEPMPVEKSALQTGRVYQTARGPAKWNGTAFEAQ